MEDHIICPDCNGSGNDDNRLLSLGIRSRACKRCRGNGYVYVPLDRVIEQAIEAAIKTDTVIRASEINLCGMIIRHINGDRNHRVIELLVSPDGFSGMGIFRTLDEYGYDHTFLYEYNGRKDDPVWRVVGMYQRGDAWAEQKTV